MSQYLAIFTGMNYENAALREQSHVEVWWNLEQAANSLTERFNTGGYYPVDIRRVDGQVERLYYPNVEVDDRLILWKVGQDEPSFLAAWQKLVEDPDPWPDYELVLGGRGGVKRNRL